MGWGLPEYLIWFEKEGLKYKPDWVVVGVHASDWENAVDGLTSLDSDGKLQIHQVPPGAQDKVREVTKWIPFYDTLVTHSALANFIRWRIIGIVHKDHQPLDHDSISAESVFYEIETHNVALLREVHRQVHATGAKLLLVFLPKYQAIYPEGDPDKVSHLFQRRISLWALDLQIPLLDITPVYRDVLDRTGKDPSHLFYLKDGHANPQAYGLIARMIADFLATRPRE